MLSQVLLAALILSPLVSAHFQLDWPVARGFDDDTLPQYPCGGQNTPSNNRTQIPLSGTIPIQVEIFGHTMTKFQVLIARGNNPSGADFHEVLVPTFQELGPRDFCFGAVPMPLSIDGVSVTSGMNATILVASNGDGGNEGGLYNCADVQFANITLSQSEYQSHCMNSTGVTAQPLANGAAANANGTGASTSSSPSSAAGSHTTNGGIPLATGASFAMAMGAGAAGLMALL